MPTFKIQVGPRTYDQHCKKLKRGGGGGGGLFFKMFFVGLKF
jgi:hypothetical protein